MKNKILTVTALSLIISGSTTYISSASSIDTDEKIKSIVEKRIVETKNASSMHFTFNNIWGGEALKLEFDTSSMKINAVARSGNFSNSNDNFTFRIIDKETANMLINESAESRYVNDFVNKINNKPFKYGDIIALDVNSSSGLKSPIVYTDGKTMSTNCIDKIQYFEITENGVVDYKPNINVSPIKILGQDTIKKTTITGSSYKNVNISAVVQGKEFSAITNENGDFSIDIESNKGFTAHTAIEVSVGALKIKIYPELLEQNNMRQETNTGYSYILNADLDTLTNPFEGEIMYGRNLLSEDGRKAWDIAYKTLLKYENTEDKYPRDSNGNVEFYIDYQSHNINISANEAQYIQKYLVKNEARMFLLKDWGAKPVYKDGVIVGQNFYIGNSAQNGTDYQEQLLQTEEAVTNILSKITPDMSVYQIIKTLQVEFEAMVDYQNVSLCGDIRGAFINKKAICGGYSKGFEYLLQRVGIENMWVNGFAGGAHAWNNINLYATWYLADSTWGGKNWYLRGSKGTENHQVYDTYHVMPTLSVDSIPWELGDRGQTIANLTGVVNYENNNDGTIKVTYEDKENINRKMQINTSLNKYKPIDMTKDENGVWNATISHAESNIDTVDFFFTVDEKYNTVGNVKANNLTTKNFENGMKNIILTTLNVSKNDLRELVNNSNYTKEDYTKTSFAKYSEALEKANKVLDNDKASSVEISTVYKELQDSIVKLIRANKIEFKGYNNVVFMTLEFDT